CLVIVEDGVDLAGHHLQAVPAEKPLRLVAAVGEKAGWPRRDRALPHRRGFRNRSLGIDLMAPVAGVADAPARGWEGEPVQRAAAAAPQPSRSPHPPGYR